MRVRRTLRRVGLAIAVFTLVVGAAVLVALLVTPSVGDAMSIARAQDRQHQVAFPGPAVPARFSEALIATEDHRFGHEPGIDPIALGRVLVGWVTGNRGQGGATLYQQLAKMLYTPVADGVTAKAEDVVLGVKLRFSYSSEQILRMYSDVVYFGHGFWGLQAASCGYFGTEPAGLSWPQAALLAGLVQAPSAYDPLNHPGLARLRQEHVVSRLVATGVLTKPRAAAILRIPVRSLTAPAGGCRRG